MRTALVHDWLTAMRGGERVLEDLCILFPEATIFTLFHRSGSVSARIESMPIRVSALNRLPGAHRYYRNLLPLFPWMVSRFDLKDFDLIISNSHSVVKGVRKGSGSLHICSCLTPMRYVWDRAPDYFHYGDPLKLRRAVLNVMRTPLRAWDRNSSKRVDHFIANSREVQHRIARCYERKSDVVYSPVDTEFFTPSPKVRAGNFFLLVTALVPYKRVDLAIDAFNRTGDRLVIVGSGPDLERLRRRANSNIEFKGFVSNEQLRKFYRSCAAVVVPGCEDFGLVTLEAQACGRPAIAYNAGGSAETISDGVTGILFPAQTIQSLSEAIRRFQHEDFDSGSLRSNACKYSRERFRAEMQMIVQQKWAEFRKNGSGFIGPQSATPMIRRDHKSVSGTSGRIKRVLDILLALAGLCILGLPILALAWLIQKDTRGPGFFTQIRLGLNGKPFVLYKLRTMYQAAERYTGPTWSLPDDPRCTRLGRILRRWGIDELPQLWNVLKGDMSIVGPRPERPEFHSSFSQMICSFDRRLAAKGGITGLAQVRGWRGSTSVRERLRSDLEYIDRWSICYDIGILLKTPFALSTKRSNAFSKAPAEEWTRDPGVREKFLNTVQNTVQNIEEPGEFETLVPENI